jgi:hypothetical protein
MRTLLALTACALLASGCEGMKEKIHDSRQERCARADWKEVGLRDGVEGISNQAGRYQDICGDMFQPAPYQDGLRQGLARRPRPPA